MPRVNEIVKNDRRYAQRDCAKSHDNSAVVLGQEQLGGPRLTISLVLSRHFGRS